MWFQRLKDSITNSISGAFKNEKQTKGAKSDNYNSILIELRKFRMAEEAKTKQLEKELNNLRADLRDVHQQITIQNQPLRLSDMLKNKRPEETEYERRQRIGNEGMDAEVSDPDGTETASDEPQLEVDQDEGTNQESDHQTEMNQVTLQAQVHADLDSSFYQQGDDIRLNLGLQSHRHQDTTTENVNNQDHLNNESTGEAQIHVQQIGSVNEPRYATEAHVTPEDHGNATDAHVTPEDHGNADELVPVPDHNDTPGAVQPQDQNRQQKTTTVECDFCSKQFKNRFTLAKHKRLQHSKDGKLRSKKKKCKTCNTFKTKNNINRHMKVCAKNMERKRLQLLDRECALCDKTFKNKASRDNHFSKMHYNEPTQCSDCDEEVTHSYLAQHKERDCKNPPFHEEEEEADAESENESEQEE